MSRLKGFHPRRGPEATPELCYILLKNRPPMLVSHNKQFIYTKTMKTASTSVEIYFEPSCRSDGQRSKGGICESRVSTAGIVGYRGPHIRGQRWYNHMPAWKIRRYLSDSVWHDYFKFCVIRNPFEKLVSAYHFYRWYFARSRGWRRTNLAVRHGLLFRARTDEVRGFRQWLAWAWWWNDRSQYMIDGKVCMDYFIRYESLMEGVQTVCDRLDIPYQPEAMPSSKSGITPKDRSLREYYDQRSIATVNRRWRFELDYFGYDVPW